MNIFGVWGVDTRKHCQKGDAILVDLGGVMYVMYYVILEI